MWKSRIDEPYVKHTCVRICQGDILRDIKFRIVYPSTDPAKENIKEIFFPYVIILSQDCDLKNSSRPPKSGKEALPGGVLIKNQFLPNVLFAPAFPIDLIASGDHFKEVFGLCQEVISSDRKKRIRQNQDDRYHFLGTFQQLQIPDLVIDFKAYFTLPIETISSLHATHYQATLSELFRERLNQRFANYFSRIGLPELYPPTPL
ncbi:MAG TPA: hypothetical protein PKI19_02100 [Elusimicrobiales bacterium]|nr:hypothetical protein [Elusimicrobiales bacterium]